MSMANWVHICLTAGFEPHNMIGMDVFLLSKRIMDDPVIRICKQEMARGTGRVPAGATIEILQRLSADELAALRKRVTV